MIIYHLESHQFLGIFCWLFLDWRQMRVSTVNRKQGEWKSIVITAGQVKLHFNKYLTGHVSSYTTKCGNHVLQHENDISHSKFRLSLQCRIRYAREGFRHLQGFRFYIYKVTNQ